MNNWSVHEDHGARGTGRARVGARGSNFEGRGQGLNRGTTTVRGHARGRGSPLYFTRIAAAPRGSVRTRARPHTDWGVEPAEVERRSTSAANEAH